MYSDDEEEEVPQHKPTRKPAYKYVDSFYFFRLIFVLVWKLLMLAANGVKLAFKHDYEQMSRAVNVYPNPRCGVAKEQSDFSDSSDESDESESSKKPKQKESPHKNNYKPDFDGYSSCDEDAEDKSFDWETGSNFSEMSTADCRYTFKKCLEHDCPHRDPGYISNLKGRKCAYLEKHGRRTSIHEQPLKTLYKAEDYDAFERIRSIQGKINKKPFSWCNYSLNETNGFHNDDLYKKPDKYAFKDPHKSVYNSYAPDIFEKPNNKEGLDPVSSWIDNSSKAQRRQWLAENSERFVSRQGNFFTSQPTLRQQFPARFSWSHGEFKRF